MTNDQLELIKMLFSALEKELSEDKQKILYRPRFSRHITFGNPLAALLLQQVNFYFKGEPFYKFAQPPEKPHKKYREGDSWTEELGCSYAQFNTARKIIGTRIKTGMSLTDHKAVVINGSVAPVSYLLLHWNDSNNVSWHWLNRPLYRIYLLQAYHPEADLSILNSIENEEMQILLGTQEAQIPFSTDTTKKGTDISLSPSGDGDTPIPIIDQYKNTLMEYGLGIQPDHPAAKSHWWYISPIACWLSGQDKPSHSRAQNAELIPGFYSPPTVPQLQVFLEFWRGKNMDMPNSVGVFAKEFGKWFATQDKPDTRTDAQIIATFTPLQHLYAEHYQDETPRQILNTSEAVMRARLDMIGVKE